jgi:lipoprotein-releasing system permease protein
MEERARPLRSATRDRLVASRVEATPQRVRSIDEWQRVGRSLEALPRVTAVSPVVSGSAFATRGGASRSVALLGVDPARFVQVVPVDEELVQGSLTLAGTDTVIGVALAADLGASIGDRIRISTADGRAQGLVVQGIFDLGSRDLNQRWVLVSQRNAQTLLDLVGGVSSIDLRVDEIFEAERVAERISAETGLDAESWMETNAQLLAALRSQSASSTLIQVFVVVAVAMGIASVLVVSVVQRSRQIGILRAMGLARRTILHVFLLQGLTVGLAGAVLGSALGALLAATFAGLLTGPGGQATFPMALEPRIFLRALGVAALTGLLAAALPARRAARLDPAVAIRHE